MESNCFLSKEVGEKRVEGLIEDLYIEINTKYNEYVIWFSDEDSIKLKIKQDINRPNNLDDFELISEYIHNNYGCKPYEIIELGSIECISL